MKKIATIVTGMGGLPQMIEDAFRAKYGKDSLQFTHITGSGLIQDVVAADGLNPAIEQRLHEVFAAARDCNPDLVLCTCSSIGAVADEEIAAHPEQKTARIDYPMCRYAVENFDRIAVMATLSTTVKPSCELVQRLADEKGKQVTIINATIDGAFAALGRGDREEATRLAVAKAEELKDQADVIILAQASMGQFMDGLKAALGDKPILTSIQSFADYLEEIL